jgi:hypothetical protein
MGVMKNSMSGLFKAPVRFNAPAIDIRQPGTVNGPGIGGNEMRASI